MKSILAKIFPGMQPKPMVHLVEVPDGIPHAAWSDPRVQAIYQILSNTDIIVPEDEHWEGYMARLCVDALANQNLTGTYEMPDFQSRVLHWLEQVIEKELIMDVQERARRFFEEATELVQSVGMTKEELLFEMDNVYAKPAGEVHQEIGGVRTTLSAFGTALGINVEECGEQELARVWTEIPRIREKNAAKKRYKKED